MAKKHGANTSRSRTRSAAGSRKTSEKKSTPADTSAAESLGGLLNLSSRSSVVNTLLSGLTRAEGERALSRIPVGRMVQRTVDDFKTRTKAIAPGSLGVTHVDAWPEERKSLERIIDVRNFLPASFLVEGARRQAAVARIRLKKPHNGLPAGSGWGTGFLLSNSLFLTNNHVIPDRQFAKSHLRVQFNFQNDLTGALLPVEEFEFDGDSFFLTSPENKLDFTLIRIRANDGGLPGAPPVMPGTKWGSIPPEDGLIAALGQKVNVIQHPDGRPKEVVLHQNEVTDVFSEVIHYRADTEPGSSGSPVFGNNWELLALHHAGGRRDASGKWVSNEGIRIDRIVADIRANAAGVLAELGL